MFYFVERMKKGRVISDTMEGKGTVKRATSMEHQKRQAFKETFSFMILSDVQHSC